MEIKKNFYPESLNNFLNFNRNSLVSTVPLTQNAGKDQTTPKVKLLCSFGGKFMPQRSNGNKCYVGGESRIIAIRRDTTIHDFYCKMQDIYDGHVRICYQLPNESLDTLVSVYSIDDFENMMEEIDYLSKASKYGCTKLWLFLFSPYDLEDVSGRFNSAVYNDCELSYIDATNKAFASEANVNGRNLKVGTIHATSTVSLNARGEEFINEGNDDISALEQQKFPAYSNVVDARNVGNQLGKVKLLCSFGGKFMPQRSEENLRYVGGQSRIIAIRRDITIHDFYCKLQDIYGGPVHICYQLPDESLNTLVSVDSIEDFNNMMEEIDNFSKASKCGCTKLWLFLFSPFNLEDLSHKTIHATSTINLNARGEEFFDDVGTRNVGNRLDKDIRRHLMHQQQPHGYRTYDSSLQRLRSQLSSIFNNNPMNNIN
ncbi:uncharacterized protein LOC110018381 isoform X1 [Phalaenopsis equestris]|uniref:uncharacterized protein LOC110018381 isoform X1 n=1 Tax=Phalaenopsis equestris TaxID=78828 RepID=UPI0009E28F55|nr:uncharacterized protein LOC110018381 isoform X1 [Phalaenopsis equestris]